MFTLAFMVAKRRWYCIGVCKCKERKHWWPY